VKRTFQPNINLGAAIPFGKERERDAVIDPQDPQHLRFAPQRRSPLPEERPPRFFQEWPAELKQEEQGGPAEGKRAEREKFVGGHIRNDTGENGSEDLTPIPPRRAAALELLEQIAHERFPPVSRCQTFQQPGRQMRWLRVFHIVFPASCGKPCQRRISVRRASRTSRSPLAVGRK